jgi:hypothetical protein
MAGKTSAIAQGNALFPAAKTRILVLVELRGSNRILISPPGQTKTGSNNYLMQALPFKLQTKAFTWFATPAISDRCH